MKLPDVRINHVEDLYVLYCLIGGISDNEFWHSPIGSVERIYQNKLAYDGWSNNPS